MPGPGEPLFLEQDTAAAVALAEEERDTCQSCGMPKAWCRTQDYEEGLGRFDVHEERCWATYRVALRREALEQEGAHSATRQAVQISPKFRKGHLPPPDAGLDLDSLD